MPTETKPSEANAAKSFQLSALITGNVHPFTFAYPEGSPYAGLSFAYRELPSGILPDLAAAVADDLAPLGVDPLASVLTAMSPGEGALKGEEYLAFMERVDSFTLAERVKYQAALGKVTGALLVAVIGEWNDTLPITAENCAALPASIQRHVLQLSQMQTLGEEKKSVSAE